MKDCLSFCLIPAVLALSGHDRSLYIKLRSPPQVQEYGCGQKVLNSSFKRLLADQKG